MQLWSISVLLHIYPIYFSDWMNCIYVLLSITVLMSDAPFRENNELYLSLRMNKYRWILSKILFIFILSAAFQFFSALQHNYVIAISGYKQRVGRCIKRIYL